LARFVESIGHRAVYFLGPLETDLRPLIEANTPNARIIDMSEARGDDTYLPWLIHAAAARAAACVAAEAGIGHLIASHGRCLLTLAGPTDARQWKPVTDRWWLLRAQDFGSDRTADIPLDAVISATKEMLDWNARSAMAG
jgi:ADP-heptose:LPS heptosyltransferase